MDLWLSVYYSEKRLLSLFMLPDKGGGMERTMIGIGIDTGGTYTDAVVYD